MVPSFVYKSTWAAKIPETRLDSPSSASGAQTRALDRIVPNVGSLNFATM